MDCPGWYNDLMALHCSCICGDRVHYVPFQYYCCGLLSTRASWCTNYCGLYGLKDDEPLFTLPLIRFLVPDSGEEISGAIEEARVAWSARLGAGKKEVEMSTNVLLK